MIYLDTAVLGAIFFREPGAADLARRLESHCMDEVLAKVATLFE